MFHIVSTLSEFKLFCANMPTWLKSGSSAGSMEAAAKSPLSPHILPSSYLFIVFLNKDAKKAPQPSYCPLFSSLLSFRTKMKLSYFYGSSELFLQKKVNFSFFSNLNLRSCSNVQKKNLRSSEKSKVAFLMSVVLPEYLMRLTPEKT